MADPLASIIDLIFGANQQAQPLANEIAGKRGEQSAASVDIASLIGQAAEEQNKVYQAEAQAKMQAQGAAAAVRNQLQNNPDQAGSLASTLTADFVSNYNKAKALRQQVNEGQNISILDDPLGYISNRLSEDDNIKQHNFFANEANTAAAALAETQSLTTAAAQAQMASAQTITADSIAAQSAENLLKARALGMEARRQAAGYDIQAIEALKAPTVELVANNLKMLEATQSARRLQLAEQSNLREEQMFRVNLADKITKEEDLQRLAQMVNASRHELGYAPIPPHQLKNSLATPEGRQQYAALIQLGSTLGPKGELNLGATTGEAILMLGVTGANFKGGAAETKDYLERIKTVIESTDPDFAGKKLTPQLADRLAQKVQAAVYGEKVKGIYRPGDLTRQAGNRDAPGNFLGAPSLPELANREAIQNLPAYKEAIAPLVDIKAAGTGNDIASATLGWFAQDPKNRLTPAVQTIVGYFKTVNHETYVNKGFSTFRMPMLQDYVTELPSAYSFSPAGKDYIDLTNPASVQDWLVNMYARQRAATSFGGVR